MIPRLDAERTMRAAMAAGLGFGGDKHGKIWRELEAEATGKRRKFVPPSPRMVAPALAQAGLGVTLITPAEFEANQRRGLEAAAAPRER